MTPQPTSVSPLTVVAVGLVFFSNGFVYASWIPRLPEIREALTMSDTVLGLTLLGAGIGGLVTSLASGFIVDRLGSRRVSIGAAVLLTATLPLIALAPAAWVLFLVLVLLGAFDGVADVAINAQAIQIQHRMTRSILTRVHGMWSLGTLGGGLIAAWAAFAGIALGLQLSVAAILMVMMLFIVRPALLPADTSLHAGDVVTVPAQMPIDAVVDLAVTDNSGIDTEVSGRATSVTAPGTGRRAVITILFIVGTMAILTELVPTEWATLVMIERFDVSVGLAGLGFVSFTSGMVIGRFGGDRMVDLFGAERFRRSSAGIVILGVTLAAFGVHPAMTLIGFVVTGIGSSALFPLAIRRAGELVAGSVGIAMFSSGARLGILIGPVIMGVASDLTSRSTSLLAISGLAALLTVLIRLPAVTARS